MFLDLTNVTASKGASSVLPEGNYTAYIDTVELKETKDGTGKYLAAMWKVSDTEFQNRTVFHNYNIVNKSAKAQEIGLGELKRVLELNGRTDFKLKSPSDLLGLHAKLYVKVEVTDKGKRNKIVNYTPATEQTTTTVTSIQKGKSSSASVPGL